MSRAKARKTWRGETLQKEMQSRGIYVRSTSYAGFAIDSKILQGKNVQMADLGGGCVCCSLLGEFEAAIDEILDTVNPDLIVVETTGVAEPDALVFDIQESLVRVRLDSVITLMDVDAMIRYPAIRHTTRIQIEAADLIVLNKIDLISKDELQIVIDKLRTINQLAPIIPTTRSDVDAASLFGIGRDRLQPAPHYLHHPELVG